MDYPDLEFAWTEKEPVDPEVQSKVLIGYVKEGMQTPRQFEWATHVVRRHQR
jgi:hypothetical protein